MEITLNLPPELSDLVSRLNQFLLIHNEAALAFPPTSTSVSAATAEPAEEQTPKASKSSKRKKDSPTEVSEPAPVVTEVAPEPTGISVEEVRQKIFGIPGGLEKAKEVLVSLGKQKLSDLSTTELVSFLAELGVA